MSKMETVEEKKSGAWKIVLAVFLTAVVIGGTAGAGAFFWQQLEIDSQRSDRNQIIEDKNSLSEKVISLNSEVDDYKKSQEAAQKKTSELTRGTTYLDAYMGALYCVGDPYVNGVVKSSKNAAVSYFATSTTSSTLDKDTHTCIAQWIEEIDTKNSITKVFMQDGVSGETKEIYSKERESKSYHLLGAEGDKLIFFDMNTDTDYSPGPCANRWVEGEHYYLDVNDTEAGMQSYIVPDSDLLKQEKKKVEECSAEI